MLYDDVDTYTHEVKHMINNLYYLARMKSDDIHTILEGMQIYYNLLYQHKKLSADLKQQFKEYNRDLFKIEIISHNQTLMNQMKNKITSQMKITSSNNCNLEITSYQATKGNAVKFLCQYLDADIQHTYGIGDNLNDLDMLSQVHYSIAVANAVDELKKVVNDVTDSYQNDGFAKAVRLLKK